MKGNRSEPGFSPKKSLGQNFLVDASVSRRIAGLLHISSEDNVLEIGPGKGALTRWLDESGPGRLVLLEKDDALAETLEASMSSAEILNQDALAYPWETLGPSWKIAGNLPYNIGSRLIWDIVSRAGGFSLAVFMVQHEVAGRLTASFGGKEYGALSVWVQSHCRIEYCFKVGPGAFRPRPRIDSAVVRLTPVKHRPESETARSLSGLIKFCFQARRKQVGPRLRREVSDDACRFLDTLGLPPSVRPEGISPEQYLELAKRLSGHFSP